MEVGRFRHIHLPFETGVREKDIEGRKRERGEEKEKERESRREGKRRRRANGNRNNFSVCLLSVESLLFVRKKTKNRRFRLQNGPKELLTHLFTLHTYIRSFHREEILHHSAVHKL
jgi:hypothetical protein